MIKVSDETRPKIGPISTNFNGRVMVTILICGLVEGTELEVTKSSQFLRAKLNELDVYLDEVRGVRG